MKKIICCAMICLAVLGGAFAISAAAFSGSGVAVVSNDVELVKTGLLGEKLNFSDSDFKRTFCVSDFDSITITKLPRSSDGTLLKQGRRVKLNQVIKRKNIAAMVFVPKSKEVGEAEFCFTVSGIGVENEFTCRMRFIDKVNYAPKAREDGSLGLTVTTQCEIGAFSKMVGSDPEGDKISFVVVAYPKYGYLKVVDSEKGLYKYTPESDFTGYDKFTYVVKDEYGNFSKCETVNIKIVERMSEKVFADMVDRTEYNAAVAMDALGVMSGEIKGDDMFFNPEVKVSKAEFVAMAMKAKGIRKNSSLTSTFFDDNEDIPSALVSYVATAQKMKIIDGDFVDSKLIFNPNKEISNYEAAMIMSRIMGLRDGGENEIFADTEGVPVWAKGAVLSMQTVGIFDTDRVKDLKATLSRADAAEYLYRMISYAK